MFQYVIKKSGISYTEIQNMIIFDFLILFEDLKSRKDE
jgi:hypothetical protein